MDYQKLRKWIRFYEKEGVSANRAVMLLYVYVFNNCLPFDSPLLPPDRVDEE